MKKIKILDFLKLLEPCHIIVWHEEDETAPIYEGDSFDFPIGWSHCYLSKGIDDEFAFSVRTDLNKTEINKKGIAGLVITVTENP